MWTLLATLGVKLPWKNCNKGRKLSPKMYTIMLYTDIDFQNGTTKNYFDDVRWVGLVNNGWESWNIWLLLLLDVSIYLGWDGLGLHLYFWKVKNEIDREWVNVKLVERSSAPNSSSGVPDQQISLILFDTCILTCAPWRCSGFLFKFQFKILRFFLIEVPIYRTKSKGLFLAPTDQKQVSDVKTQWLKTISKSFRKKRSVTKQKWKCVLLLLMY